MFVISVIICSYNPKPEYFLRTLEGLRQQTLPFSQWQLLLIDNASDTELSKVFDITWHPNGKHIREPKLGKAWAYLAGIDNAEGELIVIVDDDNILNPDYLEQARAIAEKFQFIGAFGGNLVGEFESPPPPWMMDKLSRIAVRDVKRNVWSNLYTWETTPVGAGLVIKSAIAKKFAQNTREHPLRQILDRKGNNTMSGGDLDLALTSIDMGFGCGLFKELQLTHIIPKQRVEKSYFLKLSEGIKVSQYILNYLRNPSSLPMIQNPIQNIILRIYNLLTKSRIEYKFFLLENRAKRKARKLIHEVTRSTK